MPTYRGSLTASHATSASGNVWGNVNKVTPPAALVIGDTIVLCDAPAGTLLTSLDHFNGDFDTGTTLAYNIGFRTKLPGGTQTNLTAFATGATALRAAVTAYAGLTFDPVKFNEPVEIVMTVTTAPTGVTGTPSINVRASGLVVGIQ
jgi:hypothetical protein